MSIHWYRELFQEGKNLGSALNMYQKNAKIMCSIFVALRLEVAHRNTPFVLHLLNKYLLCIWKLPDGLQLFL